MSVLARLAALYPWPAAASEDLDRALSFLDWEADGDTVVRAGYGLGLLGLPAALVAGAVAPPGLRVPALLASLALATLAVHLVHTVPKLLARARRTRALADAPDLVARAVISMRLSPSPERAAAFAAESGRGPLAATLDRHRRRPREGETALVGAGETWREWFPSFARALSLVSAAGSMTDDDREGTLDRALAVVLEGTRTRTSEFAASIRGPATALYAFGVLLPLALVALVPAAHAAGVGVSGWTIVVVYDLLLPVCLIAAAGWLLSRRPVVFPPPAVTTDHPDVPDRRALAVLVGLLVAVGGWLVVVQVVPSWGGPVVAVGFGAGLPLVVNFRPALSVHERVRAVEEGLTDALALVGRRVANGTAVERALPEAADQLDGAMGDVLAAAARRQRELGVGVRESLLGPNGALAGVPSPRVHSSVAVLALAVGEGEQAGSALLALAEHVDDLRTVEAEARRDLDAVCGTLQTTAAVFGPLVAGATVALADGIATAGGALPGGGEPIAWLGLSVGWYVLVLAAVLAALATALTRGFDRALVGYRVGRTLLAATAVYLAAYLLVGAVA